MGFFYHYESDTIIYRIAITQGQHTIIDVEDAPKVLKFDILHHQTKRLKVDS